MNTNATFWLFVCIEINSGRDPHGLRGNGSPAQASTVLTSCSRCAKSHGGRTSSRLPWTVRNIIRNADYVEITHGYEAIRVVFGADFYVRFLFLFKEN